MEIDAGRRQSVTSLDYAANGEGFFGSDMSLAEARELHIDLFGNTSLLWRQPGAELPIGASLRRTGGIWRSRWLRMIRMSAWSKTFGIKSSSKWSSSPRGDADRIFSGPRSMLGLIFSYLLWVSLTSLCMANIYSVNTQPRFERSLSECRERRMYRHC